MEERRARSQEAKGGGVMENEDGTSSKEYMKMTLFPFCYAYILLPFIEV
jgi:hypothetical protein